MKITYSKSEPYKSGWKGWADWIDVFVDGSKIGQLQAEGCDHRKYMNYSFYDAIGPFADSPRSGVKVHVDEIGLRAAKTKLEAALVEWFKQKESAA